MSQIPKCMELTQEDVEQLMAAYSFLGTKTCETDMKDYVFGRRADGNYVIDVSKTWAKITLAARAIAAVENPKDVVLISARELGQRAILKFARYTGCTAIAGRFTPGTFTNRVTKAFIEPSLLIVNDPRLDHQAVNETAYANIPVIALADTDAPMSYVDIAIPCNNKAANSIGLIYWLLAREVLRIRGEISREEEWAVMPDMFIYRSPEEIEQQEAADAAEQEQEWDMQAAPEAGEDVAVPAADEEWDNAVTDGTWA